MISRFLSLYLLIPACLSAADPIPLPNGLSMTPLAAPHSILLPLNPGLPEFPNFTLSQAVTTALSPDGRQLLVLTSGYNRASRARRNWNEYVFVYDVMGPKPVQVEALPVPNSFCGLAWNPSGQEFYVSGGPDDKVYVFARGQKGFERAAAIALGHPRGLGLLSNAPPPFNEAAPKPIAAGIAVNQTGTVAVVANIYNDSISVVNLKERKKIGELDLRPDPTGHVAGGEFPYWVAIHRDDKAYISSPRDREIVVVRLRASAGGNAAPSVISRIKVSGQPNRLLLNREQDRLFVALDNSDSVAVIDTGRDQQVASFNVLAPPDLLPRGPAPKGANPNSLALSPDERTLYVTDGGTNALAVVALNPNGSGQVAGLIPTAWYPNSVSVSADGKSLFVVNSKSVPGPNPTNCRGDVKAPNIPDCANGNGLQYVLTLEKASLWAAPVPAPAELAALTRQVARNNRLDRVAQPGADPIFEQLHGKIQHVIYIVKENRTYDQILGDLEVGDGDPALTEFPESVTPNHHSFARRFVTLDNFYDSGEVSGVGWKWSVGGRTTDYTEKTVPINYAGRGFAYDWEGLNRNVNVGYASLAERMKAQPLLSPDPKHPADPALLPGDADVAAPDGAEGEAGAGYIWDEALRAGLTVRNYGFYTDLGRYDNPGKNPSYIAISKTPFADKLVQAYATTKALVSRTDPYFRGFDQNNADFYNFQEWEREFDQFAADGNLPALSLVRFCHDHFGNFGTARYGLNTPAMQIADNDYAIGLLAQKIAHSAYKDNTLIFVIEDDAQDGPDHVDAHRSVGFVVGPYVKQGAVISERYSTVSMIRTIEAVLGLAPSSLYSAAAGPMTEVFDLNQTAWDYKAIVPDLLRTSQLPLPKALAENSLHPSTHMLASAVDRHSGAWWQKKLGDMDYDEEDKLDTPRFNRELWKGIMGKQPYPVERSGKDLRENREELLEQYWVR